MSRWENGNNMPDISILIELAEFYDVDMRELLNGERKSENMDKDVKETLEMVAEYTDTEKEKILKSITINVILGAAAFLFLYIMLLFGSTVGLNDVKWSRGGYDKTALSKLYTGYDLRVMLILKELNKYVSDMDKVKGLGFCVSKEHAEYMAVMFNKSDIPSIALTADSKKDERDPAQSRLAKGEIKFIFTVDLYNEGVDIPEVNTIMFLRPTEKVTLFCWRLRRHGGSLKMSLTA